MAPKNSPNFIHALLKGDSIFELSIPSTKKIPEIPIIYRLGFPLFFKGQSPIIKNTIKNIIPKLLLEL